MQFIIIRMPLIAKFIIIRMPLIKNNFAFLSEITYHSNLQKFFKAEKCIFYFVNYLIYYLNFEIDIDEATLSCALCSIRGTVIFSLPIFAQANASSLLSQFIFCK